MLHLTRLNGQAFALNPDLIERAEATPDTVVTLVNGSKYVIRETLDELIGCVQAYRAELVIASRSGTANTHGAHGTHSTHSPAGSARARVAARQAAADITDAASAANATATVLPLRLERGEL